MLMENYLLHFKPSVDFQLMLILPTDILLVFWHELSR